MLDTMLGSAEQDGGQRPSQVHHLGDDELGYMADMIGELNKLARDRGLETLAGLLALAQVEARRSGQATKRTF